MINRVLMPREILVGGGSRFKLSQVLAATGVRKPLLVTDPVMVKLGHAQALQASLAEAGLAADIFSHVVEDPTDISVGDVVTRIKAGEHDGLVALGGSSALDTAKAAAI
uniref:iron-containing alcohol dehydrogenase n=1 Tax=Rhizobium sp. TaxID=391 RepID=UPI0028B20659